jgi:hypothetical protein
METLKLEKSTAKKLFQEAPEWFKKILSDTFGNECFSGKIIDRIKTYDQAYMEADDQTRIDCQLFTTDTPDVVAYKKLKLIVKVINEGWKPDWSNTSQAKYYPWFNVLPSGSGFGFSNAHYSYVLSCTGVGSRLCFESSEKCEYVAKQFTSLYEDFLLTK